VVWDTVLGIGAVDAEAVWDEWLRITRFLEAARLAFAREAELWTSLETVEPVTLDVTTSKGRYRVDVADHLTAVQDDETLLASVLIHTYALAESAAVDHLSIGARDLGGIEDWGDRLLASENRSWRDLQDGLAGAVEVAVVRNAFAHGQRTIDASGERRLRAAGVSSWSAGDSVSLTYDQLQVYRRCLRHMLGLAGIRRATRT